MIYTWSLMFPYINQLNLVLYSVRIIYRCRPLHKQGYIPWALLHLLSYHWEKTWSICGMEEELLDDRHTQCAVRQLVWTTCNNCWNCMMTALTACTTGCTSTGIYVVAVSLTCLTCIHFLSVTSTECSSVIIILGSNYADMSVKEWIRNAFYIYGSMI